MNNIEDAEEHIFNLCVAFYETMQLTRLNSSWPKDYKHNIKLIDEAIEYIGEDKLCG